MMQQGKAATDAVWLQPVLWQQPARPEQPGALECSLGEGGHGWGKPAQVFRLSSLVAAQPAVDTELQF